MGNPTQAALAGNIGASHVAAMRVAMLTGFSPDHNKPLSRIFVS